MLTTAIDGATLIVTMTRPPANAINEEWITELTRILDENEFRDDLRVVRFRSGLPLFCAGADIDLLAERLASADGVARMVDTVRRLQESSASNARRLSPSPRSTARPSAAATNGLSPATSASPPRRRAWDCRRERWDCSRPPVAPNA